MADNIKKITLAKIDFDFGTALNDISDLSKRIIALKEANKQLKKEGKEGGETFEANKIKIKQLSDEYRVQSKVIKDFTNEQTDMNKVITDTDGSIKQLEAALARNREIYRKLTQDQRDNVEVGGALLEIIEKQDDEYKRLQTSIGTTAVNVGNYEEAIKSALEGQKAYGDVFNTTIVQLNSFKQQLLSVRNTFIATNKTVGGTNKTLGLFKAALAATGIGLLLIALGSLINLLTKTQGGIDKTRAALKGVEAVFNVITDLSIKLGQSLVNLFKNPKESIKQLGEALVTNILNRFRAIGIGAESLGKIFQALVKKDIEGLKEASKQLQTAFVQATTGLDAAQQNKIAQGLSDITSEMRAEAQQAFKLEEQLIALEKQEANLEVQRAKSRAEIKRLNLIAEDTTKNEEERAKAARAAISIEQGLLNQRIANQKKRISILKQQNDLSTSTEADLQRVRDAEIELAGFREESLELQTTLNNKLNILEQKKISDQQAIIDKQSELEEEKRKLSEETAKKQQEAINDIISRNFTETQALNQKFAEELKAIGAAGKEREDLTQDQLDALILLESEYQKDLAEVRKKAKDDQFAKQILEAQEELRRNQVQNTIELNQELLLLEDNEKAKAKLKEQFRVKELESEKAYLQQSLQLIQAQLAENLTASADGTTLIDSVLSDEDRQKLTDNLNAIKAQILEFEVAITEAKDRLTKEGQTSVLQTIIGLDDEQFEKFQQGFQIATDSINNILNLASSGIEARSQKQINQLNKLRDNDLISQKEYDKRKETIERKAFERQKKIQATLATISFLQGVINILSAPSTIPQPFAAIYKAVQVGILGATYGINLSKIKSQQYEEGGLIKGLSHKRGGVPFTVKGRGGFEAEGGEFIVNKQATSKNLPLLRAINNSTLSGIRKRKFAAGDIVGRSISSSVNSQLRGSQSVSDVLISDEYFDRLIAAYESAKAPELNIVDLSTEQSRQSKIKELITV